VFFDDFYPFSNKSDLFFHALNGMMPHWSPFFDNRLVDIALNLPLKHRLGRNLVDATTVALDESIASVPHGKTGVPPSQTFPMNVLQRYTRELSKRIVGPDEPPKPYLTHGPWVDTAELARSHEFVIEKLREKKPIIDALPFLDNGGVERCYEEHLNGENNQFELYTLLSFLHMPIVERAVEDTTNPQSTR
jgi:asparagine synthase (glutamine-hydrolysing)